MGNLKISGNTTQSQDWDISNILDDYMDMCLIVRFFAWIHG